MSPLRKWSRLFPFFGLCLTVGVGCHRYSAQDPRVSPEPSANGIPGVTFIEIPGLSMRLGEGFNSVSASASGHLCVFLNRENDVVALKAHETPGKVIPHPRSRQGVREVMDLAAVVSEFVMGSARLLSYPPVEEVFSVTASNTRKLFAEIISYEGEIFQAQKSDKLNSEEDCGDRFIYRITTGAALAIIFSLDFAHAEDRLLFERNFGKEAPFGEGSRPRRENEMQRFLEGRGAFDLKVAQLGGDTESVSRLLENSTCRGAKLSDCKQVMARLRTQFRASLQRNSAPVRGDSDPQWLGPWRVIGFSTRPYGAE